MRSIYQKNRAALLLLAGFIWLPSEVVAQERIPAATELIFMTVTPDFDYTKQGRAKFVRTLSGYCREILNRLPTNTPSEDAWVASEGHTTDMAKVNRLVGTPEYSRRQLRQTFVDCEKTTKRLEQLPGKYETTIVSKYEAIYLVSLALNFNSDKDIQNYASRAGLKPEELGFDFLDAVRRSLLIAASTALSYK